MTTSHTHEEQYILERCGRETPFSVPEGYFQQFTPRMMQRIGQEKPATVTSILPRRHLWRYAAAVVMLGGTALAALTYTYRSLNQARAESAAMEMEQYEEDMLDYTMMSNTEIHAYLTEVD